MFLNKLSSLYRRLIAFWFIFMTSSAFLAVECSAFDDHKAEKVTPYKILALGDSLTAGYGLNRADGLVPQLSGWLNAQDLDQPIAITNAGVSGDTTQGGRSRVAWSLTPFGKAGPDLVMVALGGNDGLRGINPAVTRANLTAIVEELQKRDLKVLLVGMQAPPNLGREYGENFNSIYPDLAKKYSVPLYPFILDGVAAIEDLNQSDGIHPNEKGVKVIVKKLGPVIKKVMLENTKGKPECGA